VNTGLLIFIIVLVVVAALVFLFSRQRRTARLREQFGPEYERTVAETGSRQAAEAELQDRRQRREKFEIAPLDSAARERYLEQWHLVQARFVDSPTEATRAADRLINEVMRDRGYPVEDFEQRAADISVDHGQVVDDYRAAHAVAEANERSEASTEDLRQALVHYRSLFEDLLDVPEADRVHVHDSETTESAGAAEAADVADDRDEPREPADLPAAEPSDRTDRIDRIDRTEGTEGTDRADRTDLDPVPAAERTRNLPPAGERTEAAAADREHLSGSDQATRTATTTPPSEPRTTEEAR
jgi:hypothetical protein